MRAASSRRARLQLATASLATIFALNCGGSPASAEDELVSRPGEQRLLLLQSGRIITGNIHHTARGYFVQKATGNMVVPNEEVRLQAVDFVDAYKKQRYAMTAPTASLRLALAKWCLTYKLYEQARAELRDALILEPDRGDIRRMLLRIEQTLDPSRGRKEASAPAKPRDVAGFELPPVESLAGLSRESALEFTRRVQPILTNKCGNVSCHGRTARNKFRLIHVRLGNGRNRTNTERNLATALQFVDFDEPRESPLLTRPQDAHGGLPRELFANSQGQKQFDTLQKWVVQLAQEHIPDKRPHTLASSHAGTQQAPPTPRVTKTSAPLPRVARPSVAFPRIATASQLSETVHPPMAPGPASAGAAGAELPNADQPNADQPTGDAEDAFFRELLRDESNDAFDPDEFNRQPAGPS